MQAAVRAINNLARTCQQMERRRRSAGLLRRRQGGNGHAGTIRQN
jgi:hypothetical protein